MEYSELFALISALTEKRDIHISIHDVSGILSYDALKLPHRLKVHSKPFCDAAKSTSYGYNLCMRCKTKANRRAVTTKEPFSGLCPFGLYEYALPVVSDNTVMCVIYVGNAVINKEKSLGKMSKAAKLCGIDHKLLNNAFSCAEYLSDSESLKNAATVVKNYITLVLSQKNLPSENRGSWRVREITEYLCANYTKSITIKQIAELWFMNEKYLGRVFKHETGLTIKQFINSERLAKAERELSHTEKSIIDIAFDAGFSNVTYFNRLFFKKHGMPPSVYRLNRSGK